MDIAKLNVNPFDERGFIKAWLEICAVMGGTDQFKNILLHQKEFSTDEVAFFLKAFLPIRYVGKSYHFTEKSIETLIKFYKLFEPEATEVQLTFRAFNQIELETIGLIKLIETTNGVTVKFIGEKGLHDHKVYRAACNFIDKNSREEIIAFRDMHLIITDHFITFPDLSYFWFLGKNDIIYTYDVSTRTLLMTDDIDNPIVEKLATISERRKNYRNLNFDPSEAAKTEETQQLKQQILSQKRDFVTFDTFIKAYGDINNYINIAEVGFTVSNADIENLDAATFTIDQPSLIMLKEYLITVRKMQDEACAPERDMMIASYFANNYHNYREGRLKVFVNDLSYYSIPNGIFNNDHFVFIIGDDYPLFVNVNLITGVLSITLKPIFDV